MVRSSIWYHNNIRCRNSTPTYLKIKLSKLVSCHIGNYTVINFLKKRDVIFATIKVTKEKELPNSLRNKYLKMLNL